MKALVMNKPEKPELNDIQKDWYSYAPNFGIRVAAIPYEDARDQIRLGMENLYTISRNGRPLKFQISVQNSCIYCNVSVHKNFCIFPVMLLTNVNFILPRHAALIAKIFLLRITQVLQFLVSYEYMMQKYYQNWLR